MRLKLEMRRLAQSGGQRAHALGLDADDLKKVDDFVEKLREEREESNKRKKKSAGVKGSKKTETEELELKVIHQVQGQCCKTVRKCNALSCMVAGQSASS